MKLSRREEFLLRCIDAGLERDDPSLHRRLATFTPADEEPATLWRPARGAILVVSVAMAAAVFLLALVVLTFQPPCRGTAAVRPSAPTPGDPPGGTRAAPAAPAAPEPPASESSRTC